MFKKINLKQQLFAAFFIIIMTTIVAILTPWGQYKIFIIAPCAVFFAFVGNLISIHLFKDSNKNDHD